MVKKDQKIEELASQGLSITKIARDLGINYGKVRYYIMIQGLHNHWKEKREKQKLEENKYPEIEKLIQEGLSMDEIGRKLNFSREWVRQYIQRKGLYDEWKTINVKLAQERPKKTIEKHKSRVTIYLKTPIPTKKRNPEIDKLIQEGLSMAEMGRRLNLSREWIRQYLQRNSLYDIWNANVKLTQECSKKTIKYHQDIMLLIALRAYELAEQKGSAYVKAIDYFLNKHKPYNSIPLEKIISLFTSHETAQQSGIELTIKELSKKSNINYESTKRILKKVGLSYINQKPRLTKLTKEKRKTIIEARRLENSIKDIAYFSKVSGSSIKRIINQDKRKVKYRKVKYIRTPPYRRSSQIYEAQDLGFTIEEISELLDINSRHIKRAFKKREIYEERIITLLNTLYPNKQHNKPYLTNNSTLKH